MQMREKQRTIFERMRRFVDRDVRICLESICEAVDVRFMRLNSKNQYVMQPMQSAKVEQTQVLTKTFKPQKELRVPVCLSRQSQFAHTRDFQRKAATSTDLLKVLSNESANQK